MDPVRGLAGAHLHSGPPRLELLLDRGDRVRNRHHDLLELVEEGRNQNEGGKREEGRNRQEGERRTESPGHSGKLQTIHERIQPIRHEHGGQERIDNPTHLVENPPREHQHDHDQDRPPFRSLAERIPEDERGQENGRQSQNRIEQVVEEQENSRKQDAAGPILGHIAIPERSR